ncbi:MAG: hypothetical protein VZR00_00115 [Lachnospiraceae bacterium]|nr:hypothetical protein [Lachnospiraceae bacterium]MEE3460281.1 hypothetical protein [Lachnospiraceae bacterium]
MGNYSKRLTKSLLVFSLILSMIFTMVPVTDAQAAKRVRLKKKSVSLYVGQKKRIVLTGARIKYVRFKVKNNKIVKVSKRGYIRGRKPGKTKVIVSYKGKKYTCRITVRSKSGQTGQATPGAVNASPSPSASPTPSPSPTHTPSAKGGDKELSKVPDTMKQAEVTASPTEAPVLQVANKSKSFSEVQADSTMYNGGIKVKIGDSVSTALNAYGYVRGPEQAGNGAYAYMLNPGGTYTNLTYIYTDKNDGTGTVKGISAAGRYAAYSNVIFTGVRYGRLKEGATVVDGGDISFNSLCSKYDLKEGSDSVAMVFNTSTSDAEVYAWCGADGCFMISAFAGDFGIEKLNADPSGTAITEQDNEVSEIMSAYRVYMKDSPFNVGSRVYLYEPYKYSNDIMQEYMKTAVTPDITGVRSLLQAKYPDKNIDMNLFSIDGNVTSSDPASIAVMFIDTSHDSDPRQRTNYLFESDYISPGLGSSGSYLLVYYLYENG